jgi:hypothetical protein
MLKSHEKFFPRQAVARLARPRQTRYRGCRPPFENLQVIEKLHE